jgi:hypothetical protein
MATYTETVVKKHPGYKNKSFLLANDDKNKLYRENGNHIEIVINGKGKLSVFEIDKNLKKTPKNIDSLRKIGTESLRLKDPSVPQMLKYLILPEMEVERIFNSIRYKYLQAVYDSEFGRPFRLFDASCNKVFQSMAGINIYQGGTKNRKDNDYFWKEMGFKPKVKKLGWKEEQDALGFILSFIRKRDSNRIDKSYLELIAIKPGFHELWIHSDYFKYYYGEKRSRYIALNILKKDSKRSLLSLKRYPKEINKKDYLSYASCNITEGPFVYRKKVNTTYYTEIRNITERTQLPELHKKFYILDYYPCHNLICSRKDLKSVLIKADKFKYYM